MFCPALGIAEDPVSGNAHGLLGVYLSRLGLLKAGAAGERISFCGLQGHYLQRPGRVTVELEMHDGAIDAVWIVGQADIDLRDRDLALARLTAPSASAFRPAPVGVQRAGRARPRGPSNTRRL